MCFHNSAVHNDDHFEVSDNDGHSADNWNKYNMHALWKLLWFNIVPLEPHKGTWQKQMSLTAYQNWVNCN